MPNDGGPAVTVLHRLAIGGLQLPVQYLQHAVGIIAYVPCGGREGGIYLIVPLKRWLIGKSRLDFPDDSVGRVDPALRQDDEYFHSRQGADEVGPAQRPFEALGDALACRVLPFLGGFAATDRAKTHLYQG